MEKVINSYESLFIVDVEGGEESTKATISKFTTLIADNAEIVETSEWGKRRLAYPINDKPEGFYVVVTFKAEPSFPSELERLFNIDEKIMRSIVLKLDYEAKPKANEVIPEEIVVDEEAETAPAEEAEPVAEEAKEEVTEEKVEEAKEESTEAVAEETKSEEVSE